MKQLKKIPSLDGFRGLSIIVVVLAHQHFFLELGIDKYFAGGKAGVYIFFVISGYLITTLLMREKELDGSISNKKFYIRRFFRIIPVAYLYLVVLYALNMRLKRGIPDYAFWGCGLFIGNIPKFRYAHWYLAHFWSLSVEEQFYIWFPFALSNIVRIKRFVLIMLGLNLFLSFIYTYFNVLQYNVFHDFVIIFCQSDAILVGALFAIWTIEGCNFSFFTHSRFKSLYTFFASLMVFFLFGHLISSDYDGILFKNKLISLAVSFIIGTLIVSNINNQRNDFVFKCLNNRFIEHIGKLSYSMYIWQQLIPELEGIVRNKFNYALNLPFKLVIIYLISYASYYFYESFFLKIKRKFSHV